MHTMKVQNTASLLPSSPSTAALSHGDPVSAGVHYKRCSAYNNKRKTLYNLLYGNIFPEMGCLKGVQDLIEQIKI